jgi:flagellar protein FliO/FliZ
MVEPGMGSVLQVSAGLAIVLAMVAGAAWLVRRLGVTPGKASGLLKVCGSIAVGQRERVVVVEVRDVWLVVGVAPGRVSTLHSLPRPEDAPLAASGPAASRAFAEWLQRALERPRA